MSRNILVILVAVVGVTLLASAQAPCTTGSTVREQYISSRLGQTMFYTVYLPPCYDADDTSYPAAYLMHGSNDDDGQWLRLGLQDVLDSAIRSGEMAPMIVVMPFGNVIANRNRFDSASWENIFISELLPDAEAKYRVDGRREGRVIGGISRGGFWAYQIAFRHPQMFSAVGGHSAFFDLYHAPPEYNPLHLASDADGIEDMRLWLDHGTEDFAAPGLAIMHERLTERGLSHTFINDRPGQHYGTYWGQHIGEYLAFYAAGFGEAQPAAQPTAPPVIGFATNTPQVPVSPLPTVTPAASGALRYDLYVPAVAFPSLLTSLPRDELAAVARGQADSRLILTETSAAGLNRAGINPHPDTRIVPDDALRSALWADYTRYALVPFGAQLLDTRPLWVDDVAVVDQLATYPLAFPALDGAFRPDRLTRLTFSGVTAITRQSIPAIDAESVAWAASGIQDYVTAVDFFHVSNEVSIVPTCPQLTGDVLGGPTSFCMKADHAAVLPLLDVDIVELTGNHNNDFGYAAYETTLAYLRDNGMQTVGGGATLAEARQPLLIDHNGSRVALLACNVPGPYYALVNEDPTLLGGVRPGAAACDGDWLQPALADLSQQVDLVVLTVQHVEYEDYLPTDAQRFDFRQWADWGADVVMGTAAHKPQTYEFYVTQRGERAFIHYGMGNLFFDQPFWGNSRFFMNTLLIYEGRLLTVELFPGIIDAQARPRLMTPEERENFLFFMLRQQNGF